MKLSTHIRKQIPYLIIYVENLERAREYYVGRLGLRAREFPIVSAMGEHALALSIQGTTLILMSRKAGELFFGKVLRDTPPGRCFPAWQVNDLEAFHRDAVSSGFLSLLEPREDNFGWVACYRDPDGLIFSVVQLKPPPNTDGIVLSGGGALGAFELGVMQVLGAKDIVTIPQVITGTSVGGYNAAVIACELGRGRSFNEAVGLLSDIWLNKIGGGYHDNGVFRFRADVRRIGAPSVPASQALGELVKDFAFFTRDTFQRVSHVALAHGSALKRLSEVVDISTVFSTDPLRNLMNCTLDYASLANSPTTLKLSTTEWRTGKLRMFSHWPAGDGASSLRREDEPINHTNFIDAVMATTAIPGVFPTIEISCRGAWDLNERLHFADGGLVLNSPLNPAIEAGARTLHLISVHPNLEEIPLDAVNNTLETLTRGIIAAVSGFIATDLDQVRLINRIAGIVRRKHSDEFYQPVAVHRYHPHIGNLGGLAGLLDFSPMHIEALIGDGIDRAAKHDCEEAGCILPV